jgi:hypothetical protein
MSEDRFSQIQPEMNVAPTPGFLVMPIATTPAAAVSPLEWMYQQLYAQAQQANQPTTTRELFSVMN